MLPDASIRDRRSLRLSPSNSDHRLTICGFLPMPPISASPICTPTVSMNAGEILQPSSSISPADAEHLHLPTWIATPPTPPTKNVRRSVTCLVRRPQSPLGPSTSFPVTAGPSTPRLVRANSDPTRPALMRCDSDVGFTRVSSPVSDLGSEAGDAWDAEKSKDDVRKYHALMELLATEASYLADLRALFSIYLRNLPTLCRTPSGTFGRGSASRTNSYTQLPKTSVLSDQALHPLTTIHAKSKPSSRHLFTASEIDLLTRNAEEVLQLHEDFVDQLRAAVLPLGFRVESPGSGDFDEKELIRNIDAAIGEISTKFATEASRFDAYQTFCIGHTQALHLVHRAQQQYPIEWEAYEQHCASLIVNLGLDGPDSRPGSVRSSSDGEDRRQQSLPPTPKNRTRTTSLTSLDGAVRKVRSLHSKDNSLDGRKRSHRLAFLDYMIKPIQRICRYPLLLDQLRPGKKLRAMAHPAVRPRTEVVVESATQAMRHVASAVDEARHRADVKMQSSLIASRIALALPASAPPNSPTQSLTTGFLSSLGTCLLAGSLDVMHYQSSKPSGNGTNINAKYLGAFLYLGGYLILVKVKGKIYEPKHWFPLADCTILDLEEEDTSLPCTFSLTGQGHQFDLTAACLREKDAWLSSIHESRLHSPSWTNEPTPSIHCDGKGELIPSTLDGPYEVIHALPTIQSLPELAKDDFDPDLTESIFRGEASQAPKPDTSFRAELMASRRSSTASVKAIFSPYSDMDTIVIRRSSPAARSQVDQGLQDVISEPVLAARSHPSARDELFQAPKILRTSSSFVRSPSALSLTGLAKNRLYRHESRHESMRVPRKKSSTDDAPLTKTPTPLRASQKQRPKRLSIVSSSEAESLFQSPSDLSASPFSQCSSLMSSFTTPVESPAVSEEQAASSRRPSLTNEPPSIPASLPSPSASQRSIPWAADHYRTLTQGILKRLGKGTRHRRARSAPQDQNIPEPTEQSLVEFGTPLASPVSQLEVTSLRPVSPPVDSSQRMHLVSASTPILSSCRHSSVDNSTSSKRTSIFKRLKLTP
ncbi:hypothetical protein C8R47DRAFT_1124570 [Mycena vitilis]|nr:hypothetical protein C8R47DRAFT_1124570 [Mycena vitilis]